MIALTSIAPDPTRVLTQRAYLETWRAAGLEPVSINHPSEIEWLATAYSEVSFDPTEHTAHAVFGRHYVRVNALCEWIARRSEPVLIINADLRVQATPAMWDALGVLASAGGLPYLLQYNVAPDGRLTIEPCGISAFVVTPALAVRLAESVLCLGKPWWDYWVPAAALQLGVKLHCPTRVLCYHAVHTRCGWTDAEWVACGVECARLLGEPLPEIAAHADVSRLSAKVYGQIVASTQAVSL